MALQIPFHSIEDLPAGFLSRPVAETTFVSDSGISQLKCARLITNRKLDAPCECVECCQQYRDQRALGVVCTNYAKITGLEEARENLNRHVKTMRADRSFLQHALQVHGNAVLSRWKKCNQNQRADILRYALPGIETVKWAILYHNYNFEEVKDEAELRNTYLLPYLSLDDLKSNPLRFLSLLHCRTKYEFDDWVLFDVRQTKAGWENGVFATQFCKYAVQMHGPDYGGVVPWEKNKAHRWDIIGFPRAQLVIEAQSVLMGFLRKTVERLLENVSSASLSSTWQRLIGDGFRKSSEEETWTVFSNLAFLGPPNFSTDRLLEVATARSANAQDHLWLLQTDMSYMRGEIQYIRQSRVANALRQRTGELNTFEWASGKLGSFPMHRVHEWHSIVEECEHVKEQHHRFRDSIHLGGVIPTPYADALGSLELMLINILLERVQELKELLPRLRGFEHCYELKWLPAIKGYKVDAKLGKDKYWFNEDPLWWCLVQLTSDPEDVQSIDSAILFGFLDDLLGPDQPKLDRTRVDQRLLDELSDLGAIWELLRAVRYHHPVFEAITLKKATVVGVERVRWRYWAAYHKWMKGSERQVQSSPAMGIAIKRFEMLNMPTGKKDETWQRQTDALHEASTMFWTRARFHIEEDLKKMGCNVEDTEFLISLVAYDTAPDHLEALRKEKEAVIASIKSKSMPAKVEGSTSQTFWGTTATETLGPGQEAQKKKTKLKSRPQKTDLKADKTPTTTPEQQGRIDTSSIKEDTSTCPMTINVKPENHKVFMTMYPSKDAAEKPTKKSLLDWRKFVGAMTDAGFSASGSGGSAVTFAHETGGRIIFHRPHPIAKVDPTMLAWFGKRLKKWFGMDRTCFVSAACGRPGKKNGKQAEDSENSAEK
jgi:HicA toxin of bacterial toxin-antitoxin,